MDLSFARIEREKNCLEGKHRYPCVTFPSSDLAIHTKDLGLHSPNECGGSARRANLGAAQQTARGAAIRHKQHSQKRVFSAQLGSRHVGVVW